MKTRIWIAIMLVAFLVTSGAVVKPAHADSDQHEWTLVGKVGHATPPGGDDGGDGDVGPDTEGDPENWLGGQNRPVGTNQDEELPRLIDWLMGFLNFLTFGLIR